MDYRALLYTYGFDWFSTCWTEAEWRAKRTLRGARLHAAYESLQYDGRQKRWPLAWESIAGEWMRTVEAHFR